MVATTTNMEHQGRGRRGLPLKAPRHLAAIHVAAAQQLHFLHLLTALTCRAATMLCELSISRTHLKPTQKDLKTQRVVSLL